MARLGRRVINHPHLYGPSSYAPPAAGITITLDPVTMVASGSVYTAGTFATTLARVTMAMTGTHSPTADKIRGTIWTKTLTGAGGSETFTASAVDEAALVYVVLHGASSVDVSGSTIGGSDIADAPSITTANGDEMVLWGHFRDAHVITVVPGSGTNVGPQASSANAVRSSVAVNYQTQAVAGASGTRRFAGAAGDSWAAATISINGVATGVTGTIARTLAPVTMNAAGTFTANVTGTIGVTLGSVTMGATGTSTPLPGTARTPTLRGELSSFPRLRKGFSTPRLD